VERRALELQGAWVRQLDIRVDAALKEVERARAELQKHQGHLESLDGALGEARAEEASLRLLLERHLGMLGLTDLTILRASRLSPALLQPTREARQDLDGRVHHARAMAQAATRALEEHEAAQPSPHPEDEAPERLQDLRTATETGLRELDERGDALRAERLEMDHRAQEKARAKASLDETRARAEVWLKLHDLIGRGDGKHFRQFAQALNLGQLLARANMHLARFSGRYALRSELDPETGLPTLEFEIVDRFRPGMPRSPRTLSGGESFLVSLALALGLADLRTSSMPVETLMLDEGFGTLDRNTLHGALAALQQLRASGRQIGIISHVSSLEDLIEDRVLVEPIGEGHSRVRVFRGPAVSRAS
jgi:exonuclease SbcC